MKNSVPYLIYLAIFKATSIFGQVGFEQYFYVQNKEMMTFVPILNFQTSSHTYMEVRYNYEELKTFSFYLGRTLSKNDKVAYSITPLLGGVIGKFKGGSAGFNATVEYSNIFFSSASQYTASFCKADSDFFFAWSDLGYQPWNWLYFGVSTQQTLLPQRKSFKAEYGIALGFTIGKWTFPLYCFNPEDDRAYLVLGINYSNTLGALKKNK